MKNNAIKSIVILIGLFFLYLLSINLMFQTKVYKTDSGEKIIRINKLTGRQVSTKSLKEKYNNFKRQQIIKEHEEDFENCVLTRKQKKIRQNRLTNSLDISLLAENPARLECVRFCVHLHEKLKKGTNAKGLINFLRLEENIPDYVSDRELIEYFVENYPSFINKNLNLDNFIDKTCTEDHGICLENLD